MGGVAPEVGRLPRQKEKSNRALGVGVCAHARAQARRAGCEPAHRCEPAHKRWADSHGGEEGFHYAGSHCAKSHQGHASLRTGEQVATEAPLIRTAALRTPPNATTPTPDVRACRLGGLPLGGRCVCPSEIFGCRDPSPSPEAQGTTWESSQATWDGSQPRPRRAMIALMSCK